MVNPTNLPGNVGPLGDWSLDRVLRIVGKMDHYNFYRRFAQLRRIHQEKAFDPRMSLM